MNRRPLFIANLPVQGEHSLHVSNKCSGEQLEEVSSASKEQIETALEKGYEARAAMAHMPAYQRSQILHHCAERCKTRRAELTHLLCLEAGKALKDAEGEVTRLIETFQIGAEEALRWDGQLQNLERQPAQQRRMALMKRVPAGLCSFITPFNFPLNLAAHKIAPAIACGCPFILKPSSLTPISALVLGEILAECDLPAGAFSILPCNREDALPLVVDDRVAHLSFTGSPAVGWQMKARCGRKKISLELGGNAACIIDENSAIETVVSRLLFGAYYLAGQSCISVQRIFVHSSLYNELRQRLCESVAALKTGDPLDEKNFCGPLIQESEALRVEAWIKDACDAGASLLCGGERAGAFVQPCLLENVPHPCQIWREEVFGPVACLEVYEDFKEVLQIVNDSDYGLQCGIFTDSNSRMMLAWKELEVGGIIINDVPSWRSDAMAYGGVKQSGLGREGVRYAMEELSEWRTMVVQC